jgi:hypothetical protein
VKPCPSCREELRGDDLGYDICWRCGHLLGAPPILIPRAAPGHETALVVDTKSTATPPVLPPGDPQPKPAKMRTMTRSHCPAITPEQVSAWSAAVEERRKTLAARDADSPDWTTERTCEWCDTPFTPRRPRQIYDRRECADGAEAERQRATRMAG